MRLAIVAIVWIQASCLKSDLPTCGELACPAAMLCVIAADRPLCVTADQLAPCAGAADGTPCPFGACFDAVCQASACGNQRVEPGEQCDDGNASAGDGCAPTCLDERCGNGITDVGEACDCGEPGAEPRPECRGYANSDDDVAAPCRTNCTLRRCGDGVLEAPEPCEGDQFGALTCANFGFYAGELTCTAFCTVDPSGCSQRCGDGILHAPQEQCDGAALGGQGCDDFSFYSGTLACSPFCSVSTVGCTGRCGDGFFNVGPEECDGGSFNGATCAQFYSTYAGALACTPFCNIDVYACHGCGDFVCEPDQGETCQNCPADCQIGAACCGDGNCAVAEANERVPGRCNCVADCEALCP